LVFVSSTSQFLNKSFIFYLLNHTNLFNTYWSGLNVVPTSTSFFSFSELALSSTTNYFRNSNILNSGVDFFFNFDELGANYTNSNSLKVYQGHHGDINAFNSHLILPTTSFIEKNSTYSNVFGMVQKTKKALFNPGNSRDDWKVLNALLEIFNSNSSRINGSIDLISYIARVTPFVLYKRKLPFSFNLHKMNVFVYFHNFSSKSISNNYYLSDNITRNSKIMSLCSIKFKNKFFNFF
jgi:hypothetical protein